MTRAEADQHQTHLFIRVNWYTYRVAPLSGVVQDGEAEQPRGLNAGVLTAVL
jgi:hypothetical protein